MEPLMNEVNTVEHIVFVKEIIPTHTRDIDTCKSAEKDTTSQSIQQEREASKQDYVYNLTQTKSLAFTDH